MLETLFKIYAENIQINNIIIISSKINIIKRSTKIKRSKDQQRSKGLRDQRDQKLINLPAAMGSKL